MSENIKTYEAEGIKIYWKSNICKHAAECVKGLPSVFNTQKRPWVSPQNGTAEKIMEVIDRCPSRALTYEQK
ncbi:(4Fe-4S)-binding protein [Bacillus sp. MM2020_1]|uniref:(4Fe-4S)-binding protein n=1 Tax=Priestia megaterium TaxID=1404 RepID=A0A6H1P547_PRIMG|nr:(4Fe-4S)-binding protein [Priestia megaterium]NHC42729.1 (4Fe-4S)-binding protein [Bacillus sp. MM2020_1]QIZ08585.1 (4Fe-4S)-binding protein [Priestia megaterium]